MWMLVADAIESGLETAPIRNGLVQDECEWRLGRTNCHAGRRPRVLSCLVEIDLYLPPQGTPAAIRMGEGGAGLAH
jgi:hypothetical protein